MKKNVITWITRISIIGVFVVTAALVILLSAFNGIETMIESLYSEFEPDITITANKRKTFDESEVNWEALNRCQGISSISKGLEEIVILRHEKKWVNATLIGVESNFLKTININKHAILGKPLFKEENGAAYGIIGAALINKLNLKLGGSDVKEQILIYAPKRNIKIRLGKNPFYSERISLSCAMNYNSEINQEKIIWPLENTRSLLNYSRNLSHIYIDVSPSIPIEEVKKKLTQIVGKAFIVKTNYEKNEVIFKTSKSEKIVVIIIMIFIFILASFNLIGSLTILFVEKKSNIAVFKSMGLNNKSLFRIFFYEGLLISGFGIVLGLLFGYLLCYLQLKFVFLTIPETEIPFPIKISWKDFTLILTSVSTISFLFTYFPVKFLIYNLKK